MASFCCGPLKACAKCCGKTADKGGCTPKDMFCSTDKPTNFFLIFSLIFHVVPGVASLAIGIISLRKTSCFAHDSTNLGIFLLIDALLALLFIIFAFRVQHLLARPYDKSEHKQHACGCHAEVYARVGRFLWTDLSFLAFLIVAVFAVVWNVIGLLWSDVVDEQYNFRYRTVCYVGIVKMARAHAGVMFSYITFAPIAFLVALFIESYRKRPDLQQAVDPEAPPPPATDAKADGAGSSSAKADTKPGSDQAKPTAAMHEAAGKMQEAAGKVELTPSAPPPPAAPVTPGEPAIGIPVDPHYAKH